MIDTLRLCDVMKLGVELDAQGVGATKRVKAVVAASEESRDRVKSPAFSLLCGERRPQF
jgi:hypothetical protein